MTLIGCCRNGSFSSLLIFALSVFTLPACRGRNVGDLLPAIFLSDGINPPMYSVGGSITNLLGQGLVLSNNGGDNLTVPAFSNSFVFSTPMRTDDSYDVQVAAYPVPPQSQQCTVSSGTGSIGNDNITGINIACNPAYTVTGSATGVVGTGLTLANNGGDFLTIAPGTTSFSFHAPVIKTTNPSNISIVAQPQNPWQDCQFTGGGISSTATYVTTDPVTIANGPIVCATKTFPVSVTISGLAYSGLTLNLTDVQDSVNTSSGSMAAGATLYNFTNNLSSGTQYSVTITSQPVGENCAIAGGSGTVQNSTVAVSIACSTTGYPAIGSLVNLKGSGFKIRYAVTPHSGTPYNRDVTVASVGGGTLDYGLALNYGDSFVATILQQPVSPGQNCIFADTTTTYTSPSITGGLTLPAITCTDNVLTGSIAGYSASTGLAITYNGSISGSQTYNVPDGATSFTLPTAVVLGETYTLSLSRAYNYGMDCTASPASGTITAQTTTVNISCSAAPKLGNPSITLVGPNNQVTMTPSSSPSVSPQTICYRTDGGIPQCSGSSGGTWLSRGGNACASGSQTYSSAIPITATTTFKIVACSGNATYDQSSIFSQTLTISGTAPTPTFSPAAGSYSNDQSVSITSAGSTIYYNTTGASMDCAGTNGTLYSAPVTVSVTGTTLYAIACQNGMSPTSSNSGVYSFQVLVPTLSGGTSAVNSITPGSGTTGASIYYTTNGSVPACGTGNLYSTPFTLTGSDTTVYAIACKNGYTASSIVGKTIRFRLNVRVSGLYAGTMSVSEAAGSPLSYTGTGNPGVTQTYGHLYYSGDNYQISVNQMSGDGPRCSPSTSSSGTFASSDIQADVICPVAYFTLSSGGRYWYRCTYGNDSWDPVSGFCTGTVGGWGIPYCNTADDSCNTLPQPGILTGGPIYGYCNNLNSNPLMAFGANAWHVPMVVSELIALDAYGKSPATNSYLGSPAIFGGGSTYLYWSEESGSTTSAWTYQFGTGTQSVIQKNVSSGMVAICVTQ